MPTGKRYFEALLSYWKGLPKNGRHVPSKASFNPMQVPKMLPYLYFGERITQFDIRLRLVGDELVEPVQMMVPSRNIYESIPRGDWDIIDQYYDRFCGTPCAGHLVRSLTFVGGLVHDIETVGLPLADEGGTPRYIVGLLDLHKNIEKSVTLQTGNVDVNKIQLLEYWDLGFGVPNVEETALAKKVTRNR